MKKIFTIFAALACVMSMSAATLYLRGDFNGWGTSNALDANGKCEIELKVGNYGFKIADATWGAANYGSDATISATTNGVQFVSGSNSNCKLKATTEGTYTFTFNANTLTLDVTYPAGEVVEIAPTVVLAGGFNEWNTTANALTNDAENLMATTTINFEVGTYEFKVVEDGAWLGDNQIITRANNSQVFETVDGSTNCSLTADVAGEYTFTWVYKTNTLTVTYPEAGENPGEEPGDDPIVTPDPEPNPEDPTGITIKAKVPATWTDQITVWVWATGLEGQEAVPTQEGEWYVYTHTGSDLNIIFKNGAGWNGDANQTEDMSFTESACIEIIASASKANYTLVDCEENPGEEPGDDPVVTPDPETGVTYTVTVPVGTKACYIAGQMNEWTQQEMTKVDETHYTLTIETATTAMKYKYCSGPSWEYVEMAADGVTDVLDRTYAANDVVESWKAVYDPAGENPGEEPGDDPVVTPDPETGVTYTVTVPVGTKACYIAGQMNEWTHQEMTKVDETHYTLTIETATTAMKYKYCSGPSWEYVEMAADGVTDVLDRTYAANDVVESWKAVYDPAGENPGEEPGDDPVVTPDPETGVTYTVTVPVGTKACYIAGQMNEWTHQEMTKVDETHYTLTIETATTAMKYKYCSGPSWEYVEMAADGVTDVLDRTYAANDVVESWKAVYDPAGEEPGEEPGDDPIVTPTDAAYVLMGVGGDWETGIAFTRNEANTLEEEYMLLGQVISEGDSVKVVGIVDGVATYYNTVDEASVSHTLSEDYQNIVLAPGTYDFYFKVASQVIYIGASLPSAVDNVTVEVKAVKVIRNGQMYILRDGVMYNAIGQIAE